MDNPIISVIVPVYNVEQYLSHCIDSIINQTFTSLELLLIDDGSKDNSGKICDEYAKKDNRIRVFHKENGGVSSARNIGLDNAQGKFICFVDSDDWLELECLSLSISNIGDADILFFAYTWNFPDGCTKKVASKDFCAEGKNEIEKSIFHLRNNYNKENLFGYPWNKLFRNDIIKSKHIRYVEGLSFCEDEIFVLSYCLSINKMKYYSKSLYNHCLRDGSLTYNNVKYEEWMLLYKYINYLETEIQNKELKQEYRNWLFQILICASKKSNILINLQHIWQAYKYAHHYKLSNYKKRILKRILQMIY